jgi:hypothetical protein
MLNLLEEEEKRKQMMGSVGAPLSAAAYQPVQEATAIQRGPAEKPGVAQQLGTQYASSKALQGMEKGGNWAWDKAKEAYNAPTAPAGAVPNEATFAGDYTNAMDQASDVLTAPLAEAPMQLGIEGTALAPTEIAQTGLADASAGLTDATAGATAGAAGPLAGAVEFAKTGDLKKGLGAGGGAAAGATLGSMVLPGVGTVIGSMIGSQLGSAIGGK